MIYGLLAALGWGSADYGATVAGRRIGSFPTVIVTAVFSALAATAILLGRGKDLGGLGANAGIHVVTGVATSAA